MLPFSCDPGYGELGVQEGVADHDEAGRAVRLQLGARHRPAGRRQPRVFADAARRTRRPSWPTSAIGQYGVQTTALQNAMVAAGIANGGVLMTPHLMSSIHDSQGALVETYTPEADVDGGVGRRRRSRSPP